MVSSISISSSSDLSVNVDDGAKKSPRPTLPIDVQHAQNLQEPNAAVTVNTDPSAISLACIRS